jgi:hypothetical protein
LDGLALREINTFIDGMMINFASPQDLLSYVEKSFSDPDPTGTARQELHELKESENFSA